MPIVMTETRALVPYRSKGSLTLTKREAPAYPWATDAECVAALEANDFNVGRAARALGVKRHMLAKRIAENADLQLEMDDFVQGVVDDAQSNVFKGVALGKNDASVSVLNALGRDRGFGKQATNLPEGVEVVIRRIEG